MCIVYTRQVPWPNFCLQWQGILYIHHNEDHGLFGLGFSGSISKKMCIYIYLFIFIIFIYIHLFIYQYIYIYICAYIHLYFILYVHNMCICFPFFLPAFRIFSRRQIRFFTSHEAMQLDLEAANGWSLTGLNGCLALGNREAPHRMTSLKFSIDTQNSHMWSYLKGDTFSKPSFLVSLNL